MKKYIFPIFITLLGFSTAYAFYIFWHSGEDHSPKQIEHPQEKVVEDLTDAAVIPKINRKNTLPVPQAPLETHSQSADEEITSQMMEKETDIPNLTPQQMQTQTEAVYDALTPENYEETMEEAAVAFEQLDTMVEEQDAKLAEEMQAVEASQEALADESMEDETAMEEIPPEEELEMSVPEDEEEVDREQEDVNNF